MSTIVLRSVKGTPLTNTEVDDNFNNLNTDKIELGGTYSSGTASGVLFLNSSKVLTSGSALTFDGSLLNTTGSIRAQTSLFVYGTGDRLNVFPQAAGSGVQLLVTNNANTDYAPLSFDGSRQVFNLFGGEQMRLTSTGLGIGTTTPRAKLDVGTNTGGSTTTDLHIGYSGLNYYGYRIINTVNPSNEGSGVFTIQGGTSAAWADRLTISDSGNLGLGVTPSASNLATIQSSYGILSGNNQANIAANAYYNNQWNYTSTAVASLYTQTAGQHRFFTAPSGTAGDAISFSQSMTLDSSGNLGIGTSSVTAGFKLDVNGNARIGNGSAQGFEIQPGALTFIGAYNRATSVYTPLDVAGEYLRFSTNNGAEKMRLDTSGNLGLGVTPSAWGSNYKSIEVSNGGGNIFGIAGNGTTGIGFNFYNNNTNDIYKFSTYAAKFQVNNAGQFVWYTAPSGTAGDAISFTQAMTLDASGNFGLGTTTTSPYRLNVLRSDGKAAFMTDGATADFAITCISGVSMVAAASTGVLALGTSGTERARIDSSGNLLVGTTSPIAGYTDAFLHVATVNTGKRGITIGNSSGSSDTGCVTFVNSNGQVGFILTSGSTTTYSTSSDYRLKNITGPITTSGAYIDSLNPVEGTWKADGSTFVGLIAHEVQEASRTTVATGVKDGEQMQGMDYSSAEIIANLIAEVKSLRQRLAAAGI